MAVRVVVKYDVQVYDTEFETVESGRYDVALATGNVRPFRHSIGATTTLDLWAASGANPATFEAFCLIADAAVYLELTTDVGNDVGTELYTVHLPAGAPFFLLSDTSYANYTANFGGGTLDVIDRIRVRNPGASAAVIRGFLAV